MHCARAFCQLMPDEFKVVIAGLFELSRGRFTTSPDTTGEEEEGAAEEVDGAGKVADGAAEEEANEPNKVKRQPSRRLQKLLQGSLTCRVVLLA